MQIRSPSLQSAPPRSRSARTLRLSCLAAALAACGPASAIDFGPFTLNGFAKAEGTRVSDDCPDCQRVQGASKAYWWADEIVQGKSYGPAYEHVTLVQPYLGAHYDVGGGFKVSGLISQRWRDGKEDFKGIWYDKSIAVTHEDYGSLRIGAMQTRAWSMADYPFGTNIGVADEWGSSGSGYGLLTHAVRYTSRTLDFADGDLVIEATYDRGTHQWTRNKPLFLETWVHYGRGDLSIDLMYQYARNGTPSAFSHGPFTSLFYDKSFDADLGGSNQSIAMAMASYKASTNLTLYGGMRGNRWSGAYAKLLEPASQNPGGYDIWNTPFNVDWSHDLGGGVYRGYAATSVDFVAGARYRMGAWTPYTGMVHLGAAATQNPSDRGQSNSATFNVVGLDYEAMQGLQLYGFGGMVNYAHKGLSPMSMPSNSAFTNVDSRLVTRGYWLGLGAVYTF